jgi:hypothetical protein
VNALMGPEERALLAQSGARAVVERLVAAQPQAFWSERAMLVQLGDKLALVRNGKVVHVLATAHSSLFPRVSALRPLAAQPNSGGWQPLAACMLPACCKVRGRLLACGGLYTALLLHYCCTRKR